MGKELTRNQATVVVIIGTITFVFGMVASIIENNSSKTTLGAAGTFSLYIGLAIALMGGVLMGFTLPEVREKQE